MLFNSFDFLLFIFIFSGFYYCFPKRNIQNLILLIFSYIFYGFWDVRFLFLIVLSTYVDFFCGLIMKRSLISKFNRCLYSLFLIICAILFVEVSWKDFEPNFNLIWYGLTSSILAVIFLNCIYQLSVSYKIKKPEKMGVTISVIVNLTILGFFKYFNFFVSSFSEMVNSFGIESNVELLNIVLPVGISFYTFQTMSYSLDIKKGSLSPTRSYLDFSVFVSFFPQLVAGPIERAQVFLPQVFKSRDFDLNALKRGLFLICLGFFKKVAIADPISRLVDPGFILGQSYNTLDVYLSTLFFTIQIYGDFSGYSDIARGLAKVFGFNLMVNFRRPYFSKVPSEFWRRWHISLSSWLRDYLYIPLGGNKFTSIKTYRNLFLTMLIGGLWHGASWNFVLWGAYQGLILVVYRLLNIVPSKSKVSQVFFHIVFFHLTMFGWLLFRANSFKLISQNISAFFNFEGINTLISRPGLPLLVSIIIIIIYEFFVEFKLYEKLKTPKRVILKEVAVGGFIGVLIFLALVGNLKPPAPFIYFQF